MRMKNNTRLTVDEFKKMCENAKTMSYVFSTDNQQHNEIETVKLSFVFDNMIILKYPNRIYLTCGEKNIWGKYDKCLSFERVKHVVFREILSGCMFFTIVCEKLGEHTDVEYCISAM